MFDGQRFVLFFAAAVVLAITPGPGIFYVLARTLSGGKREGVLSALGTMESSVFGLVDHAHPTAAELLDDAVVRDGLANQGRLAVCAIILGAKSWQVNESGSL